MHPTLLVVLTLINWWIICYFVHAFTPYFSYVLQWPHLWIESKSHFLCEHKFKDTIMPERSETSRERLCIFRCTLSSAKPAKQCQPAIPVWQQKMYSFSAFCIRVIYRGRKERHLYFVLFGIFAIYFVALILKSELQRFKRFREFFESKLTIHHLNRVSFFFVVRIMNK